MSDHSKIHKIFDINDRAASFGEDLAMIASTPLANNFVCNIIKMCYDDYAPLCLLWRLPCGETAYNAMWQFASNYDQAVRLSLMTRFNEEVQSINAHLQSLFTFKTWGYIFVRLVGNSIIIEDNGDRRIDEWNVITANGTLTPDAVVSATISMLEQQKELGTEIDFNTLVNSVYSLARVRSGM